jgi:hypothetical protein
MDNAGVILLDKSLLIMFVHVPLMHLGINLENVLYVLPISQSTLLKQIALVPLILIFRMEYVSLSTVQLTANSTVTTKSVSVKANTCILSYTKKIDATTLHAQKDQDILIPSTPAADAQ